MDKNKILFVDDEINVISAIRRGVADEPYQSFFAGSAQEALAVMEKYEISVLVTDMRMPGIDGLTLLKLVKEKYPKTVRVVLSGYTQLSQMLATINQGEIFKFIAKPWTTDQDLLPALRQAIDYYNLQVERDVLRDNLAQRNLMYQNILRKMEQKLAEEKEELQNLKEISGWMFSFWRKYISSLSADSAEHFVKLERFVEEIETIYVTYLSQLPAVVDVKDMSGYINEIVKSCNNRLVIKHDSLRDFRTQGKHKYLIMVFKIILHNLPDVYKKVICNLTEDRKESQKATLLFEMELSPNQLSNEEKNKLKISCALLSKIGKGYNVSVSSEHKGDEISSIRVLWEVTEV